MLKNILAFGASNSKHSINKQFAAFATDRLKEVQTTLLDLHDFELPLYSVDVEREIGIPNNVLRFSEHIAQSDAIVISVAEHNGLYTSAFKNLWDWMSRLGSPLIWQGKPMLLLSTSISKRKEIYVMRVSKELFPKVGATVVASFHLPSFNHFLKNGEITEPELKESFEEALQKFETYLSEKTSLL